MNKFTYEEVAMCLGVSRTTLYNWQAEGRIPKGDYDLEKLSQAVEVAIALKDEEAEKAKREARQIRSRFRVFETERLATA